MIARPSAQALLIEMQFQGLVLATGTGFICKAPGGWMLITARHNVTGVDQNTGKSLAKNLGIPDQVFVNYGVGNPPTNWEGYSTPLYQEGKPLWLEHPTLGAKADFVALPINPPGAVNYFAVEFNTREDPQKELKLSPADAVSVVGFPFGLTAGGKYPVWATGFLASEPEIDFNGLPIQLIDCRTRQGQSGAPVFAFRAGGAKNLVNGSVEMGGGSQQRFIGIYTGRVNSESDIGHVWKASAVKELVDSITTGGSQD